MQAEYLLLAREHLGARMASRRASLSQYRAWASSAGFPFLDAPAGCLENGYLAVSLVRDPGRKLALENRLRANGIGFGNVYPKPMSAQPGARPHLAGRLGGQVAEAVCASVVNLPLFPYMRDDELQAVTDALAGL